jgi:hypothetical protein
MHARQPYGEQAARHAGEVTRHSDALLERSKGQPAPLAPIGAVLVIVLGLWVWASIPILHLPYTDPAWNTSLRDEGAAVVMTLAGLRLLFSPRSTLSALMAAAAGLALVVSGIWAPHIVERSALNEIITGAAAILAAVTARAGAGRSV